MVVVSSLYSPSYLSQDGHGAPLRLGTPSSEINPPFVRYGFQRSCVNWIDTDSSTRFVPWRIGPFAHRRVNSSLPSKSNLSQLSLYPPPKSPFRKLEAPLMTLLTVAWIVSAMVSIDCPTALPAFCKALTVVFAACETPAAMLVAVDLIASPAR